MSVILRDTFFKIFGDGHFQGEAPIFVGHDIEALIAFSRTFHIETFIEIGIQRGETARCILGNSPSIRNYIGIDIAPTALTNLPIQQGEIPIVAGELVNHDPRVNLIVTPNGSRDLTALDLPVADLIFIDGDHSFNGVILDTILARQTVRKGGIICWHDFGNPLVPSVSAAINSMNNAEGDHICLIDGGTLCFQFCGEGR